MPGAWTEDQQRRVLAFLEELTGGKPLDELRREADACRDSADLDIARTRRERLADWLTVPLDRLRGRA